jgi:hypothetical protein
MPTMRAREPYPTGTDSNHHPGGDGRRGAPSSPRGVPPLSPMPAAGSPCGAAGPESALAEGGRRQDESDMPRGPPGGQGATARMPRVPGPR